MAKNNVGATIEQLNSWYNNGLAYQSMLGLHTTIPMCVRFYEGDQWPSVTKKTKYFPRPVVNIIELNCNNKKAQVLSSPVKIVYRCPKKDVAVDKFNRFAEYELKRIRQNEISNKAIIDGMVKGSYCMYYYWDDSVVGVDGLVEGDIAAQVIDPINVLFANPNEKNIQKQDWVMIVSRESIDRLERIADSDIDTAKICEDNSDSIYNESESDTEKYATVLTRFFRINGEVYFERATKEVIFNKARPLTPNVEKFKQLINGENENIEKRQYNKFLRQPKATLYPIVFKSWKDRDKSIYGRGEVEAIIPNQKAINWTLGLQVLMAQNEGMSPVVALPNALRGQTVTNEPGQVLIDYSNTGKGIQFLNKQGMTQASISLTDKIADLTRVSIGSSEVMNGEVISAGMSGAAIAQLQSQALKPVQDLQKAYFRAMEDVGEILEQFFRLYYVQKKYYFEDNNTGGLINEEFDSSDYFDVCFDVTAEAVAGTVMSDVADINILDNLFSKNAIDLKTYIKCYPDNAIANRQKLIDTIEEQENNIVAQLTMQLEQVQAQLSQALELVNKQEQAVNNSQTIVNENRTLKEKLLSLQAEYSQKVQQANQILANIALKTKDYYNDAKSMATEVAKSRGLM